MRKLYKQNLKVLNTTTALQIIIVNWALRATTGNSRVSFIDLYLVFPTNFRIVFLPHTNTENLQEPYCGTITEPGLLVSDTRQRNFFSMTIVPFPGHFLGHLTLPSQQFYHRSPQNKTKQKLTQNWKTTESIW